MIERGCILFPTIMRGVFSSSCNNKLIMNRKAKRVPRQQCIIRKWWERLEEKEAKYFINERLCRNRRKAKMLISKVLRSWYNWPTIQLDCNTFFYKCDKFQRISKTILLRSYIRLWPNGLSTHKGLTALAFSHLPQLNWNL